LQGQFTIAKEQIMQFKATLGNLSRRSYIITNNEEKSAQQGYTSACMCNVQYALIL